MKNKHERLSKYERMGMAALLPGMVYEHERLGKEIERFRFVLAQDEEIEPEKTGKGSAQAAYWARMTPAQRRYEMQRRGMTRAKKNQQQMRAQPGEMTKRGTPAKMHPRDKRHPGHDAWIEKLKAVQKKAWNKRRAA